MSKILAIGIDRNRWHNKPDWFYTEVVLRFLFLPWYHCLVNETVNMFANIRYNVIEHVFHFFSSYSSH